MHKKIQEQKLYSNLGYKKSKEVIVNMVLANAPPSSLMNSTMNPIMKIAERGIGACSLARNTLRVEGRARTPEWVRTNDKQFNYSHGPTQTK
jgi:hypothetical protein